MKGLKFCALVLSAGMLLSSCGGNMNNTGKGSLIGAGGGAALGTLIGTLASSNKGKGAGIGAAVGVAVGAGVGALIGKKMDKAKAAAQQVENAQVESVTDANGLQAVKVTFDSGILFNTSSSALSSNATASLAKFASTVLNVNKDMDVAIKGYTDNQGWKNSSPKRAKEYGPVVTTGQFCFQLPETMRSFPDTDNIGRRLGRSRPRSRQQYGCRTRAEPSCGSLFVCQ